MSFLPPPVPSPAATNTIVRLVIELAFIVNTIVPALGPSYASREAIPGDGGAGVPAFRTCDPSIGANIRLGEGCRVARDFFHQLIASVSVMISPNDER